MKVVEGDEVSLSIAIEGVKELGGRIARYVTQSMVVDEGGIWRAFKGVAGDKGRVWNKGVEGVGGGEEVWGGKGGRG